MKWAHIKVNLVVRLLALSGVVYIVSLLIIVMSGPIPSIVQPVEFNLHERPLHRHNRVSKYSSKLINTTNHKYPDYSKKPILPKILAIYFPQFHRDALNNRLWGAGFTDWDNLRRAPELNRKGYRIPRPTELGYYDLENYTVRKMQGNLAREYGVDGFVYHHYWFYDALHPGPTLQTPLMRMLEDGEPNLPFCLHWATETWKATWFKKPENDTAVREADLKKQVLQEQFVPEPDDPRIEMHYFWMKPFFDHENYIKVDGKPMFMIYVIIEGIHAVLSRLNELAIEDGFPGLHFVSSQYATHPVLLPYGIDRANQTSLTGKNAIFDRITNYPFPYDWTRREPMHAPLWCMSKNPNGQSRSSMLTGIVTYFDNTPRRELSNARIWITHNGIKGLLHHFARNLWAAVFYHSCCYAEGGENQFILINAWNEWAEAMTLEPNDVFNRSFLEIIQHIKQDFRTCGNASSEKRKKKYKK